MTATSRIAQSLQPVLQQAGEIGEWAGLDANASDGDAAQPPTPSIQTIFNVNVAMESGQPLSDREAIRDALVDILRDGARRQGLDL